MSEKYKIFNPGQAYFMTFTTVRWIDVFTRPVYNDIIVDSLNYCVLNKGLIVHAWVLMTNHVHLIVRSEAKPIESIVRDIKRHTSKSIYECIKRNGLESRDWMTYLFDRAGDWNSMNLNHQFWQNGYHPVAMDTNKKMLQRLNYTHLNPVRAGFVSSADHWNYSSAIDYCGGKGMVALELVDPYVQGKRLELY